MAQYKALFFAFVAITLFSCGSHDSNEPALQSSSSSDIAQSSSSSDATPNSSSSETGYSSSLAEPPTLCGETEYNAETHFCQAITNKILPLCGGRTYPNTHFCLDGQRIRIHDNCINFADGTEIEHYGKSKPQFCDPRDGNRYVYVTIGDQTWTAENMKFNATGSRCYNNDETLCEIYGRLYNINSTGTICPEGWYFPTQYDWEELFDAAGGENVAGKHLKTESDWKTEGGSEGLDTYGFSILPGGWHQMGGTTSILRYERAIFWIIHPTGNRNYRIFYDKDEVELNNTLNSNYLLSVRCIKD